MTRSLRYWLLVPSLSLTLLTGCETAPEGVEGGVEESDLSGIVMEKDELAGDLGKAQSISGKEGEIKQQQAEFLELSAAFEQLRAAAVARFMEQRTAEAELPVIDQGPAVKKKKKRSKAAQTTRKLRPSAVAPKNAAAEGA